MTNKTYTVAGVSTLNNVTKVRFANDLEKREKILSKNGHEAITLIDLGAEMTKGEAARVLYFHPDFQDNVSLGAIEDYVTRNAVDVAKDLGLVQPKQKQNKKDKAAEASGFNGNYPANGYGPYDNTPVEGETAEAEDTTAEAETETEDDEQFEM